MRSGDQPGPPAWGVPGKGVTVKRLATWLMLVVFALGVACGSTATTVTTEGSTPTTVKGVEHHPLPHNIPFE
jgi:hypothetical protein